MLCANGTENAGMWNRLWAVGCRRAHSHPGTASSCSICRGTRLGLGRPLSFCRLTCGHQRGGGGGGLMDHAKGTLAQRLRDSEVAHIALPNLAVII